MGSGFNNWVYWRFFTITVNYNSSHIELILNDICLANALLRISHCSHTSEWVWVWVWVLCYDRRSVRQSVLVSCWGLGQDFYCCQTVAGLLIWGALSDERTGLPFTVAADPRQRSHSRVRVPGDSWPYFTVSGSRLPQPGGPGPCIYIPPEEGGPVITPGTGFPFRHLLRLAGIRWRYSTPPPHGEPNRDHHIQGFH
jgi:hypothetical protein